MHNIKTIEIEMKGEIIGTGGIHTFDVKKINLGCGSLERELSQLKCEGIEATILTMSTINYEDNTSERKPCILLQKDNPKEDFALYNLGSSIIPQWYLVKF